MKVTTLNLFPIKSTRAYTVQQAFVLPQGLNFDREFMITELDGTFITARKEVELFRLSAFPIPQGLIISHQEGNHCAVRYADFQQQAPSEVWQTVFPSLIANDEVNSWLSHYLKRPVQLRWLGNYSQRKLVQTNHSMSFADSYPLLLTSEASLTELQQWVDDEISMAHFRANIVIDGLKPFAEEQWQYLKIGEVIFRVIQCCTRCILTARNPDSLQLHPALEPFRTLKQRHCNAQGKPIFGIHLIPQQNGVIRINDTVTVIH